MRGPKEKVNLMCAPAAGRVERGQRACPTILVREVFEKPACTST